MQLIIRILMVLLLLCAPVALSAAVAQDTDKKTITIDKRKLLVPPRNADGSFLETPFSQDPKRWLQDKQRNFYAKLSGSIRSLKTNATATTGWTLFLLSFLYGVFHAAGPGHGKAVISTWVLATENELRRGIAISALSAFFQALTAVIVVTVLLLFVSGAAGLAKDAAGFLESASYALIAAMGLYLLWTAFKRSHGHNHPHTDQNAAPAGPFELISRPNSGHDIIHVHDEHCGHVHAPPIAELKQELTWTRAIAMAFAVGLRPCTGAFLVLLSAWQLGVFWAGVASTFIMGFGVFLTTSAIAVAAVGAKAYALRFAALDNRRLAQTVKYLKIIGGLIIAALGAFLFWASLGSTNMMM